MYIFLGAVQKWNNACGGGEGTEKCGGTEKCDKVWQGGG